MTRARARARARALARSLPRRRAIRVQAYSTSLDGVLTFFLTMELCEGGDLSRRLARVRRAPQAARAGRGGGGGAIDARARYRAGRSSSRRGSRPCTRRASRDLKPANVLLSAASDEAAAVKLDFGLARQAFAGDEMLGFSTRLGTPVYAAPEL